MGSPENNRFIQGPAELISDHHDDVMVHEQTAGKSFAEMMTDRFGEEGTGWGHETDAQQHEALNAELKRQGILRKMGNVVVYPDGKLHAVIKQDIEEMRIDVRKVTPDDKEAA